MSDGTMASHVSPIEESEMIDVRKMFEKVVNVMLSYSELSKIAKALRDDFDSLRREVDDLRQRNATLDEALANTRRQRDDAIGELSQVKSQLGAEQRNHHVLADELSVAILKTDQLVASLAQATRDRDDYMLRHMESEEALGKANDKLAKLHDVLGIKPEPIQPTPTPIVDPTPQSEPALPNPWPPSQAANY